MITVISTADEPANRSGRLLYLTMIMQVVQAEIKAGIGFQATRIFYGYTGIAARLI